MLSSRHLWTIALTSLLAGPAWAEDPASFSVDVVLGSGDQAPLTLTLALADAHGCAEVKESRRDAAYQVKVCREGGDDSAPILAFDVERNLHGAQGTETRHIRVKARLALGKEARVGRYGEGKSVLEVMARVRRIEP